MLVRIALGWFGLSCVVCGAWLLSTMWVRRFDRFGVTVAGVLLLSGAALLCGAVHVQL